jgi:hypothetical protein
MQDAVTVQQPQDMQRPRIKIKTVFEVVKRYQKPTLIYCLAFQNRQQPQPNCQSLKRHQKCRSTATA